jgi:V-type H+-transporting ATPase subunit d
MIDNVVLLITGTLHERNPEELREKCHPLGLFPTMSTITVEHSIAGLYNEVLIDTPLGTYYFKRYY